MRLVLLPGVFRPRSDSWMLARLVREMAKPGMRVLDVCTGSGVAAIGAAQAGAVTTAVDVSRRAVANVRLNALLNGVRVDARCADLTSGLEDSRFDLISANPPYVPGEPAAGAHPGPARAWEGGWDGRSLIDRLIEESASRLVPGGTLLLVHSSICGFDATRERMTQAGMEPQVLQSDRGPLGPLMHSRRGLLQSRGLIEPGQSEEQVAVLAGRLAGRAAGVV